MSGAVKIAIIGGHIVLSLLSIASLPAQILSSFTRIFILSLHMTDGIIEPLEIIGD